MRPSRLISVLVTLAVAFCAGVGTISAAPANAPSADHFEVACSDGATYSIVVNGNGIFSPGHVEAADGTNLIPVALDAVGVNADGDVLFAESFTKPGRLTGMNDDLVTCTFTDVVEEDGQIITIHATVTVFITPRG